MSELQASELYDSLRPTVGAPLRGVIRYRGTTVDSELRADVRDSYTDEELRAFVDDSIVHQLSQPDGERALKLGKIEGVVRVYEDAWVFRMSLGRDLKRGCLISIDRDGDASLSVVEECDEVVRRTLEA